MSSESELRERKKNPEVEAALAKFKARVPEIVGDGSREEMTERQKHELTQELESLIKTCNQKNKLPGITNKTRDAKDKLDEDPYNMDLMLDVGLAYIEEDKPERACNVLIRGWKRVGEYEDKIMKEGYLWALISASMLCNKWRQAHAIFMDTEEPGTATQEEKERRMEYNLEACKIYSKNDMMQPALKSFTKACESVEFQKAYENYMGVAEYLKEVGALEAAKSTLEKLAKTDEDKKKVEDADKVAMFKEMLSLQAQEDATKGQISMKILICLLVVIMIIWMYFMYHLEQKSLAKLKLSDK